MATTLYENGRVLRLRHAPHVLLAAPKSEQRTALEALLHSLGHSLDIVSDGATLLETLEQSAVIPVVILDIDLPGLSGMALLHRLQFQSARRRSWTILLTAFDDIVETGVSGLSWESGADDVFSKPVDEFELRVSLRAAARIQARCAEMAEAIDAANFHASHDSLTGLWNRESLLNLLFQETDRTQRLGNPLAFLLLDLDRFAQINRDHGYDGGDRVLRQLSSRFRRFLRSYDVAGRCGGNQFLVALPGCTVEDARNMAVRLRDCVADRPFDILQNMVTMTASIGIASSDGRSPLAVLREAEGALASAKLAGGGCVRCFVPLAASSASASTPSRQPLRHETTSVSV